MFALFRNLFLVFISICILGCDATPTTESTGQYIDNSALTLKVKAELIDKLGADGLAIKVKTYKGQVQLSGFVNNQIVKRRAAYYASHLLGVKQVINNLLVK